MRPVSFQRSRPREEMLARLEEQTGRVFDHLREKVLGNGLTFADNFQGVPVTFQDFLVPDEWTALPLVAPFTVWNPAAPPLYRWHAEHWEFRGLVRFPAGQALGYGSVFADIPGGTRLLNSETPAVAFNSWALLSMDSAGLLAFVNTGASTATTGWISLNNVKFLATLTTPPEWPKASQLRRVLPPNARAASGFLILSVTAKDGSAVGTVSIDPVVERVGAETQLRIRSASGLVAGKRYTLSLFILTE